jgi:hypothetical protein
LRSLARPPADLTGFPAYQLLPHYRLFRIHRAEHQPWWFSNSGHDRFDLRPPSGTCYLAEEPVGAFVEVFQGFDDTIPLSDVQVRRLSFLSVPKEMRLADCTSSKARRFGITGEIHSSTGRSRTQTWARSFARAGFDGVRFLVRHDPAQRRVGIALFGTGGQADWPVRSTDDIGADLLLEVERLFGIRVEP